jgi:hypothetical protein
MVVAAGEVLMLGLLALEGRGEAVTVPIVTCQPVQQGLLIQEVVAAEVVAVGRAEVQAAQAAQVS